VAGVYLFRSYCLSGSSMEHSYICSRYITLFLGKKWRFISFILRDTGKLRCSMFHQNWLGNRWSLLSFDILICVRRKELEEVRKTAVSLGRVRPKFELITSRLRVQLNISSRSGLTECRRNTRRKVKAACRV